jgi:3-hydroxyisobutyrate dehydrogenase-like beta-hydroxyacid dehydrogenase
VRLVGRLGAGATVKLAANAANMSTMVCLGEVLALTDRDGLEPEVVLDALGLGPLGSFVDRFRDKVLGRVSDVDFRLALARKDLALALEEGESDGLTLTIPRSAMVRCDEAIGAGRADQDNTSVIPDIRSRAESG